MKRERMHSRGVSGAKEGHLHEECGVFGIYSDGSVNPAYAAYNGLLALQHRGQESCGIAVNDRGVISCSKDMGLVSEVFSHETLDRLIGQMAVGHVRYSTAGASVRENAQPLVMRYVKGTLAIAHNGNLTNAYELHQKLARQGCIFQTTIDTEVVAYMIARERVNAPSIEEAIHRVMPKIQGAYSMVVMSPQKLIAFRDPHGFRPLCIGKVGNCWVFASETCALDACGAEFVRDVRPGEIVIADKNGLRNIYDPVSVKKSLCIFEYIYFARPDSVLAGKSVYAVRKALGHCLAHRAPCPGAHMVTGMPDSGTIASMGFAEGSGLPYEKAIVRNRYVGRTFIDPTQRVRELGVRIKLNPITELTKDRKIVVIDDSIVRGTTSQRIIAMIRSCGAQEIHVRISSPPVCFPCYYGIDTPSRVELAAARMDIKELQKKIGADSLQYITEEDLITAIGLPKSELCTACFTGEYMEGEEPDDLEL